MVEERKQIRKDITNVYDTIEPLLIDSKFEEVNNLYRNTDVDKATNSSLVAMMSIMMRWKKYLDKDMIKDFYDRTYNRFLKQFNEEETKSIFEGWSDSIIEITK